MFDVADSLREAFTMADDRLREAQHAVARCEIDGTRRGADTAMAQAARGAIFTEALLGATRARLQEIQAAAKS